MAHIQLIHDFTSKLFNPRLTKLFCNTSNQGGLLHPLPRFPDKIGETSKFRYKSSEYQNFTGFFAYTKGKW